jgi:hypothetical protein
MHIFKSRNPIWLILDIVIAVLLWREAILVAAIFFTLDSLIQLIYTVLPDMVDAWDKNKNYRIFYTLFFAIALFFIVRHLTDVNAI